MYHPFSLMTPIFCTHGKAPIVCFYSSPTSSTRVQARSLASAHMCLHLCRGSRFLRTGSKVAAAFLQTMEQTLEWIARGHVVSAFVHRMLSGMCCFAAAVENGPPGSIS